MDFEFNEQQKMFKAALETVVKKEIKPLLAKYPSNKPLPKEVLLKILQLYAPLGALGITVPESAGGSGLDYVSMGIVAETAPDAASFQVGSANLQAARLFYGASEEIKARLLPPLLAGKIIGGSCNSEPNAGSDPRAIETKAVPVSDGYLITGTKIWASHATVADFLLVAASMGRDDKGRNIISRFLVEPSVSKYEARDQEIMGLQEHHLCEVHFDNCWVPKGNMIGEKGDAHRILTKTWLFRRPTIGLGSVYIAQEAYNASLEYAKTRRQFGKLIGEFQLIQSYLVEMATLIEASRLLCYKALVALDRGEWCSKESSMAKFFAAEAAMRVTSLAISIHGSYGVCTDYPVEKLFRDARTMTFPDGTIEIQKLIVGRELLGLRAFVG